LEGKYEPRDNTERLILLGACRFKNQTCAAAQLYAEVFAANPTLADDQRFSHRYNAARAAALAGCGQGQDAAGLGATERKRWRDQAREWLGADLASWGKALDRDPAAARESVRQRLPKWRVDDDLAGLREPTELESCLSGKGMTASHFGPK
jgi:serine/threonine-protein kinase